MQTLGIYEAHYPTSLLFLLLMSGWNEISLLWLERQMPITGLWIWTLGAQYVVWFGRIMEPSRYGAQLQEVCCGCELWECVGVPCFVWLRCDLSTFCSWCPVPPPPPHRHLYEHITLTNLKCMNSSLILLWNFIKATERWLIQVWACLSRVRLNLLIYNKSRNSHHMNICDLSLGSKGWKMPRPSYEPATEDAQKQEMSHEACPPCMTMKGLQKTTFPASALD